jgi:SAM-dependent methyltransferase
MTGHLVQQHYVRAGLADAFGRFTPEELASFDELHSRARQATSELAALAGLRQGMRVLDVGSGLGGPARHLAASYGLHVTGLELTAEYVRVARLLTDRAGLSDRVGFEQGSALSAPFPTRTFDCVWLQHVLVNVADKARLFAELKRVLTPGGCLALHEVVSPGGHRPSFPLPWGRSPLTSYVPGPDRLRTAIENAGFTVRSWTDTTPLAAEWCRGVDDFGAEDVRLAGLSATLGEDARQMIANLGRDLDSGRLGVIMAVFDKTN